MSGPQSVIVEFQVEGSLLTNKVQTRVPTHEETVEAIAMLRSMCGLLHDEYERAGGVEKVIAELDADEIAA